ncbi:MAG TPA: hypothetical protein VGR95_21765 [Thermoanaerobaculia bacterium]|nr:hypothetical protein [Thermoanaerobaculia bacterium]
MKTFVVAVAAAALLAACPGPRREDYSQGGPSQKSQSNRNPQAVTGNSTNLNPVIARQRDIPSAKPGAIAAKTADVELIEYQITIPDTLPSGPMTLNVANGGKEDHSLVIDGNGYHAALPEPLKRGDRTTLDIDLKPGTYQVYCPVEGHKGKGMVRTIRVTSTPAPH